MKSSVSSLVLAGLLTALTALLSMISIPLGASAVTLQTFAVALAGYLLAPRRAVLSVGAYLLLGACGLPVFSQFQGGPGVLLGPTGGFLWGFPLMALCCSLGAGKPRMRTAAGLIGLLIVYLTGTVQLSWAAQISLKQAALTGIVPFAAKDAVSVWAADRMAKTLSQRMGRRMNAR